MNSVIIYYQCVILLKYAEVTDDVIKKKEAIDRVMKHQALEMMITGGKLTTCENAAPCVIKNYPDQVMPRHWTTIHNSTVKMF